MVLPLVAFFESCIVQPVMTWIFKSRFNEKACAIS